MPAFTPIGANGTVEPIDPNADYMTLSPTVRTQDERFRSELRSFYRERDGTEFANDQELLQHFYTDRNWREINTVSIGREVYDASQMNTDQRARAVRIQQTWDALPSFWRVGPLRGDGEEGRGFGALADILPAAIIDPLNAIPTARGVVVGARAAAAGRSGIAAGARAGAVVDASVNAAIGAGADVALQARDRAIGARADTDLGQVATAAGLGAILGGVFGGAFGAVGGRSGANRYHSLMSEVQPLIDGAPPGVDQAVVRDYISSLIVADAIPRSGVTRLTPDNARAIVIDFIGRDVAERDTLAARALAHAENEYASWEPNRQATRATEEAAGGQAEAQSWTGPNPPPAPAQTADQGIDLLRNRLRADLAEDPTQRTVLAGRLAELETLRDFPTFRDAEQRRINDLHLEDPNKARDPRARLIEMESRYDELQAVIQRGLTTDDAVDLGLRRFFGDEEPPVAATGAPPPPPPPPPQGGGGVAAAATPPPGAAAAAPPPTATAAPVQPSPGATPTAAAPAAQAAPAAPAAAPAAPLATATEGLAAAVRQTIEPRLKGLEYTPEDIAKLTPREARKIVKDSIRKGTGGDPTVGRPPVEPVPAPAPAAAATEPAPTVADPVAAATAAVEAPMPAKPKPYTNKQALADLQGMGIKEADAKALLRDVLAGLPKATDRAKRTEQASKAYARVIAEQSLRIAEFGKIAKVLEAVGENARDIPVVEAMLRAEFPDEADALIARYREEVLKFLSLDEPMPPLTEPQRSAIERQARLHELRVRARNAKAPLKKQLTEPEITAEVEAFRVRAAETINEPPDDRKNPAVSSTHRTGVLAEGKVAKTKTNPLTGLLEQYFKPLKTYSRNIGGAPTSVHANNIGHVWVISPTGARVEIGIGKGIPDGEVHADFEGIAALANIRRGGKPADDSTDPLRFVWQGKAGRAADGTPLVQGQTYYFAPLTNRVYATADAAFNPRAASRSVNPPRAATAAAPAPTGGDRELAKAQAMAWLRSGDISDPKRIAEFSQRLADINTRLPKAPAPAPSTPASTVSPAAQPYYAQFRNLPDQTLNTVAAYATPPEQEAARAILAERLPLVPLGANSSAKTAQTPKTAESAKTEEVGTPTQAVPTRTQAVPTEVGVQPVIALRSRLDGTLRVAYPNQMVGKTPEQSVAMLLGKSNSADWEAGTLAMSNDSSRPRPERIAEAAKDFTPDGGKSADGRVKATEAPAPKADEPALPPVITDAKFGRQKVMLDGKEMTVADAYDRMIALEKVDFPATALAMKVRIEELAKVYAVLPEFRRPVATREEAVAQINKIFTDPANRSAALDFIRRLGGDPNAAPIIQEGLSASNSNRVAMRGIEPNAISLISEGDALAQVGRHKPHVSSLYHEVFHWAYDNILSNDDKMRFWQHILKEYEGGDIKGAMAARAAGSPTPSTTTPNWSAFNPAEYFATQGEQWMAASGRMPTPDTLWQKFYAVFKAIVDRFFLKENISPDLEALFAKILPDEAGASRVARPLVDPKTEGGRASLNALKQIDGWRLNLERNLNTQSGRDLIGSIENAARGLVGRSDDEALNGTQRLRIANQGNAALQLASEAPNQSMDRADVALRTMGNQIVETLYEMEHAHKFAFEAAENGQPRFGNPHDQVRRAQIDPSTPQGKFVSTIQNRWHDLQQHRIDLQELLNSEDISAVNGILEIVQAIHGGTPISKGGKMSRVGGFLGMHGVFKKDLIEGWAQVFSRAGEIAQSAKAPTVEAIEGGVAGPGVKTALPIDQAMSQLRAMWGDIANAIDEMDNGLNNRFKKHALGGFDLRTNSNAYEPPIRTRLLTAIEMKRAAIQAADEAEGRAAAVETQTTARGAEPRRPNISLVETHRHTVTASDAFVQSHIAGGETSFGAGGQNVVFDVLDGQQSVGQLDIEVSADGKSAHVHNIRGDIIPKGEKLAPDGSVIRPMGVAAIRGALDRFRELHPEVVNISGSRVSGARRVFSNPDLPLSEQRRGNAAIELPSLTDKLPPHVLDSDLLLARLKAAKPKTDEQRNLALEVARREKLKLPTFEAGKYDREMSQLGGVDLVARIKTALVDADRDTASRAIAELVRRADKKPAIRNSDLAFHVEDGGVNTAIRKELDHLEGTATEDGVPPNAPTSWREMIRRMTHRNPEAQVTIRTMMHRMLTLLSPHMQGAVGSAEVMSVGDLYRLVGRPLPAGQEPRAAFSDFNSPVYHDLRDRLRRVGIGITSGKASPVDVMHEISHLAYGLLPELDRQFVDRAYALATAKREPLAGMVAAVEPKRALAVEEWFSEGGALYMAERVSRGDAFANRLKGTSADIQLMGRLEMALDRLVQYVAYMVNGLIGREDMRQMYRRLFLFGDMLDGPRLQGSGFASGIAFDPKVARHAGAEILNARSNDNADRMRAMVANGLGADEDGEVRLFYHGSPNGRALSDPDVILNESADGMVGPGFYAVDKPEVAGEFSRGIDASIARFLDGSGDDSVNRRVMVMATSREMALHRLDTLIGDREVAVSLRQGTGDLDERIAKLRGRVEATDARLEELGVAAQPTVLPLVIRVLSPFNADASVYRGDPLIAKVNSWLGENGYRPVQNADYAEPLSFYKATVNAVMRKYAVAPTARAEVRRMLEEFGHDGISYDHMGGLAVAVFQPPGGSNVKHVNAKWFDFGDPKLYHSDLPFNEAEFRPAGAIALAGLTNDGRPEIRNALPFMEGITASGATNRVADMARRILRMQPDANAVETARYFSAPLQLRTNSSRARADGAHYIADFAAPENGTGYYDRYASELGKLVVPLFRFMNDLTGNTGVSRWKANVKFWGDKIQPDEFSHAVGALRRGDPSSLNGNERQIYEKVRAFFSERHRAMRDAGIDVGYAGPDYVNQVWSTAKIDRNRDVVRSFLADYFEKEANLADDRMPITRDQAIAKANGVIKTLTDENGVYTPSGANSRSATGDHTDYQRMLRLNEKDKSGKLKFPDELRNLEPFMENDLQALISKYADNTTKRIAMHKQYGVKNHAFHDYTAMIVYGQRAIAELLEKDRIVRTDRMTPTDLGVQVEMLEDRQLWGMRAEEAYAAQLRAMEIVKTAKSPGEIRSQVSDYLNGLRADLPDRAKAVYGKRVEAIANALADYKGRDMPIPRGEVEFLHAMHRSMMGKSIMSGPFHESSLGASRAIRNFNAVTLLSFTTLTSIPDLGMSLIRGGSGKAWLKGLSQFASDPAYRQAIKNVGASVESIVNENMAMLHGGGQSRVTQAYFNGIGLQPWTTMGRDVAAAVGYEAFKTHAKMMRDNFVPGQIAQNRKYRVSKRFLDHFGLTDYGSGAKGLDDIAVLGTDDRVREAMVKFANESLFSPNKNDIPLWGQTPWGAIVFQLKSYPLMAGRLSRHVLKEATNGNVTPLIYMLSIGTGLGATSLAIKDLVQGRGGEAKDNEFTHQLRERSLNRIAENFGYEPNLHGSVQQFLGWYIESFMALGGLGMVADLLYQSAGQLDNGAYGQMRIASALFGPTVGTGFDALTVASGVVEELGGDDANARQRAGVRAIVGRVPGLGGVRTAREALTSAVGGEPG